MEKKENMNRKLKWKEQKKERGKVEKEGGDVEKEKGY